LDAMDTTDTPGYWQDKEPRMHHGHPLHGCLGCSGPFKATYTYFDTRRENGRFASPTRSWRVIRDARAGTEGRRQWRVSSEWCALPEDSAAGVT
jgi:hypothetical protein